jgi:hypothetical protein
MTRRPRTQSILVLTDHALVKQKLNIGSDVELVLLAQRDNVVLEHREVVAVAADAANIGSPEETGYS